MTNRDDVAAALTALESAARDVEPAEVPALLGELRRVEAIAWGRLVLFPAPAPMNGQPEHDVIVDDVPEVARLVRRSVSWVRKNGHTLPGFRQPGGKGTRVAWSRRALEAWAASPTS